MNLQTKESSGKQKKNRRLNQSRQEARQEEKKQAALEAYESYKAKKDKPYNRTFDTFEPDNTDVLGRVERKKYKQQARLQVGFISWVFGLFTGLIGLLLVWSFLQTSDFTIGSDWVANTEAEPMITETTSEDTQTDVAPAVATDGQEQTQEASEESGDDDVPTVTIDEPNGSSESAGDE